MVQMVNRAIDYNMYFNFVKYKNKYEYNIAITNKIYHNPQNINFVFSKYCNIAVPI